MLAELLIMLGLSSVDNGFKALSGTEETDRWGVYLDGNHQWRITPGLQRVYFGRNQYGERCYKYCSNGAVAINVEEELAKENKQEAIKKGHNFYCRAGDGCALGNPDIQGARYCRTDDNDDVYYVRRFGEYTDPDTRKEYCGTFYMDMNFNFICPTDETRQKDIELYGKEKTEEYEIIIREFNSRKDKDKTFCRSHTFVCGRPKHFYTDGKRIY